MATRRKRTSRRRVSGTAAVGRTRRRRSAHTSHSPRRRRRVSGTSAVGSTHSRRRRRSVGKTSIQSMGKQIIPLAIGMAVGAAGTAMLLRPLEHKIAQKHPGVAKWFAVGEILLGGFIAIKAKNPIVKGVGLGVMAGGVQTGAQQLRLYRQSPAVQGMGDYTTVQVPVNGQVQDMLAGIVRNQNGIVRTSLVAGSDMGDSEMGDMEMGYADIGAEDENYLQPKMGWSYENREQMDRTNLLAGIWGLY